MSATFTSFDFAEFTVSYWQLNITCSAVKKNIVRGNLQVWKFSIMFSKWCRFVWDKENHSHSNRRSVPTHGRGRKLVEIFSSFFIRKASRGCNRNYVLKCYQLMIYFHLWEARVNVSKICISEVPILISDVAVDWQRDVYLFNQRQNGARLQRVRRYDTTICTACCLYVVPKVYRSYGSYSQNVLSCNPYRILWKQLHRVHESKQHDQVQFIIIVFFIFYKRTVIPPDLNKCWCSQKC